MALTVGELVATLQVADTAYNKGLDDAERKFRSADRSIERSSKDTGSKIGKHFGGAALRVRGLGGSLTTVAGIAGGALLGGIAAGGLALFKFAGDAEESRRVSNLTAAAIKSTGGAAHITTDQVGDLATAISNKTGADDEAIQSGENLLLTFTDVRNEVGKGNDIFNQATSMVTDMTAALNNGDVSAQGIKASSIQLGKALNDPIKGVGALSKVGVSFTQQQKDQIKTLVESGDKLGAQKVILAELRKEFGGAAAAAASPMTRLKTVMGNFGETIGGFVLPVVDKIATFLGTVLPKASDLASTAVGALVGAFQEGDVTSDGFIGVMERIGVALRGVAGFVRDDVLPVLRRLGAFVRDVLVPFVAKVLTGALAGLRQAFEHVRAKIAEHEPQLRRLWQAFVIIEKFVASKLGPILAWLAKYVFVALGYAIGGVITGIAWLVDNVPKLVSKIGSIGASVVAFVKDIPGFVKDLPGNVAKGIGDLAGTLVQKGKDLITGLWTGADDKAEDLGKFFAKLPGRVVIWLGTVSATLTGKGITLLGSLIVGLGKKAPDIAGFFIKLPGRTLLWLGSLSATLTAKGITLLGSLLVGLGRKVVDVGSFFIKLPGRVLLWLGNLSGTLTRKGIDILVGFLAGLLSQWGNVGKWIGQRKDSVLAWIGTATGWLTQKGRDVITGFLTGLKDIWDDVTKWVGNIATWIKDHKGPVSLDARLLVPAGQAIMHGFLNGLKSGAGRAWDFVKSVGGKTKEAVAAAYGWVKGIGWPAEEAVIPPDLLKNLGRTGVLGNIRIGEALAAARGWTGGQWAALYKLWQGESGWNNLADNPTSTAFGIPQFLAGTARQYGVYGVTDPARQIAAGLRYIADAYGSPANAYSKWLARSPHWYEKGAWDIPGLQLAMLHPHELVMPARPAEQFRRSAGAGVTIIFPSGGDSITRAFFAWLKDKIRVEYGGNVQAAIGTGTAR